MDTSPFFKLGPISCEKYSNHEYYQQYVATQYCRIIDPKYIKYIAGPHYFSYVKLGEKKIYLFGENFNITNPCDDGYPDTVSFAGLLESMLKYNKNNTQYELFFEELFDLEGYEMNYSSSKFMTSIQAIFYYCILDKPIPCPYDNLKIECVDIRYKTLKKEDQVLYDSLYKTKPTQAQALELIHITERISDLSSIRDLYHDKNIYNELKSMIRNNLESFKKTEDIKFLKQANSMLVSLYTIGKILNSDRNEIFFYGNSFNASTISKTLIKFGAKDIYKDHLDRDQGCVKIDVESIFNFKSK